MEDGMKTNGVAYWRGTVDSKLKSLEEKADSTEQKIDKLIEKVDALSRRREKDEGKFVEWEWIRNKFSAPIVLAVVTFFLFTIMPSIFVLIYFLPKLAELNP